MQMTIQDLFDSIDKNSNYLINLLPDNDSKFIEVFSGETLLLRAIDYGNLELTELLLKKGSDPLQVLDGVSAVVYAATKGENMMSLVFSFIKTDIPLEQLNKAILWLTDYEVYRKQDKRTCSFDVFQMLIDKGASVDATNSYKTPLLDTALSFRKFDLARWLINKGADVKPIIAKERLRPLYDEMMK